MSLGPAGRAAEEGQWRGPAVQPAVTGSLPSRMLDAFSSEQEQALYNRRRVGTLFVRRIGGMPAALLPSRWDRRPEKSQVPVLYRYHAAGLVKIDPDRYPVSRVHRRAGHLSLMITSRKQCDQSRNPRTRSTKLSRTAYRTAAWFADPPNRFSLNYVEPWNGVSHR